METFWQDLRYGVRMLKKSPGVTALAIIALGLGIGVNTSMFSLVNAVLLRPLPYRDPGQLVQIKREIARGGDGPNVFGDGEVLSGPDFFEWKENAQSFSQLAAFSGDGVNITGGERAERVQAGQVTADFFALLGVQPFLGRDFFPTEDVPNAERVAVLTHALWRRRFSADPEILGKSIPIDGQATTVIGVLPATFVFREAFELYLPFRMNPVTERAGRQIALLEILGRLKPGVSFERARADLETVMARLKPVVNLPPNLPVMIPAPVAGGVDEVVEATATPFGEAKIPKPPGNEMISMPFPGPGAGPTMEPLGGSPGRINLVGWHEQLVGNVRSTLMILLGAVGCVLLIACANVANLLLARASARRKEIAIRTALGAARARVLRQLLTESVLLAGAGALVGLLLAYWSLDLARAYASAHLATLRPIRIDGWVLAFTAGAALGTGILFGIAPAFHAMREGVNAALKGGSQTGGTGQTRNRFRSGLVVLESALAVMLLMGAGLLVRSFLELRNTDKGFQPEGALTASIVLSRERYRDSAQQAQFVQGVLERMRALPGVEAAGAADHVPLTDYSMMMRTGVEGQGSDAARTTASFISVTPEFFPALKFKLRDGRFFNDGDAAQAPAVVIVNEAFARKFLPGQTAIGRRVRAPGVEGDFATIVGVIGNVTARELEGPAQLEVYRPFAQAPNNRLRLAIRGAGDGAALSAALRGVVKTLDVDQPITEVMTMEERLAGAFAPRRLNMILLGIFAGLAMALSAVGIYGVMSYVVSQRTHEIGVRMALGAQARDVFNLIVSHGMTLAGAGVAVGLLGSLALTRSLRSMLYGVGPLDPLTFALVPLGLAAVAFVACWIPARRATKADPMRALRCE